MDKAQLKAQICEFIAADRAHIEALSQSIFVEPELGFKEFKTSSKFQRALDDVGIAYEAGLAKTGVKARLKGRQSLKTVALLGELDAIVCRQHPVSDPQTGAAHCCGHNVQIANVLAVARAFKALNVMDYLDGDVVFFAVPAEEYVEIDYRNALREKGELQFLGGKQELIAQGAFDDIDMAMMMHVGVAKSDEGEFNLGGSSNGFVGKLIQYKGRAAHAAGAPDQGVNALNAAMMGVMGVNALRETFRDQDCVRFHPIINSGGDLVNVIPDDVRMESYCRAANVQALARYNKDINRALRAGAMALNAQCVIEDLPGYLPLQPDVKMRDLMGQSAQAIFGDKVLVGDHSAGSTDMGDVSQLMPSVHPWVGCVKGTMHGANYEVNLPEVAYVKSPQVLAMLIVDLLFDQAQQAQEICQAFHAEFDKAGYINFLQELTKND